MKTIDICRSFFNSSSYSAVAAVRIIIGLHIRRMSSHWHAHAFEVHSRCRKRQHLNWFQMLKLIIVKAKLCQFIVAKRFKKKKQFFASFRPTRQRTTVPQGNNRNNKKQRSQHLYSICWKDNELCADDGAMMRAYLETTRRTGKHAEDYMDEYHSVHHHSLRWFDANVSDSKSVRNMCTFVSAGCDYAICVHMCSVTHSIHMPTRNKYTLLNWMTCMVYGFMTVVGVVAVVAVFSTAQWRWTEFGLQHQHQHRTVCVFLMHRYHPSYWLS